HRFLDQLFAEGGQFLHDDFEIVYRLAPGRLRDVHQMDQQPRALDMPQELDAQPMPQVRAFNQPGDVGDHEAAEIIELHDSQLRLKRGERIIGDLGPRRRETRDQGRLSGIGEPDQADVGKQLQLEPEPALLAGMAGLVFRRRLVSGSGEAGISASSAPALCGEKAFARSCEIVELIAGIRVIDHRANRSLDINRPALMAGTAASLPMSATLTFVLWIETEMKECVLVWACDQINVASAPAIAAARPSARDELLSPEGETAIAAVATLDVNPDFVDEHEW